MADKLDPSLLPELREIGLFGGLDDARLEAFAAGLAVVELEPGTAAFVEGTPGREMFVVLEGMAEAVCRDPGGATRTLAVFGPGDLFGEMALLDVMPRSATVKARTRARLLRVTSGDLESLYRRDPRAYALVIMNVTREISRRLRATNAALLEALSGFEAGERSGVRRRDPRAASSFLSKGSRSK